MKYNLTINLKALHEIAPNLDFNDVAILDWLRLYCTTPNEKIEDHRIIDLKGNKLTWVDQKTLLDDIPYLKIKSKGPLTRRYQKLSKLGLIEMKYGGGYRQYIRTLPKLELAFTEVKIDSTSSVLLQNNASVVTKQSQRSFKTTNYNTKDTNTIDKKTPLPPKQYEYLNCPNPQGHDACLQELEDTSKNFNKTFNLDPRQVSAYHKITEKGFTPKQVEHCIQQIDEDPFYTSRGWDYFDIYRLLMKGGEKYVLKENRR